MAFNSKKWTPDQCAEWERIRKTGKNRFVWRRGIGGFGGFIFFLILFANLRDMPLLQSFNGAFVIAPIAGYFWGVMVWRENENAYQRALEDKL